MKLFGCRWCSAEDVVPPPCLFEDAAPLPYFPENIASHSEVNRELVFSPWDLPRRLIFLLVSWGLLFWLLVWDLTVFVYVLSLHREMKKKKSQINCYSSFVHLESDITGLSLWEKKQKKSVFGFGFSFDCSMQFLCHCFKTLYNIETFIYIQNSTYFCVEIPRTNGNSINTEVYNLCMKMILHAPWTTLMVLQEAIKNLRSRTFKIFFQPDFFCKVNSSPLFLQILLMTQFQW